MFSYLFVGVFLIFQGQNIITIFIYSYILFFILKQIKAVMHVMEEK